VRFTSGSNQRVSWVPGIGTWALASDPKVKEHFEPVQTLTVFENVCQLLIAEWNYIGFEHRHIGPMARDFHVAFPFNEKRHPTERYRSARRNIGGDPGIE
jgi:hypothetical protein